MRKEKRIFFVRSDFQYIVCKGIIEECGFKNENCIFVSDRETKVEDCYEQSPLYGINGYLHLRDRIKFYLRNKRTVKDFFCHNDITLYLPFSFIYPSLTSYNVCFYEEGLSAYSVENSPVEISNLRKLFWDIVLFVVSPFNRKVRDYLKGFTCNEKELRYPAKLFSFSENCYKIITDERIEKIVIPIPHKPVEYYNVPENSIVFVMDRLSSSGRPFKLDNLRSVIHHQMERLKSEGHHHVFVKFHPADCENKETGTWISEILSAHNIEYTIFNGRLEYLALQNIGIEFIGTNSTILFYAPILGNTNKSISFYKELADIDDQYKQFIAEWGDFEHFYSKNVICI